MEGHEASETYISSGLSARALYILQHMNVSCVRKPIVLLVAYTEIMQNSIGN